MAHGGEHPTIAFGSLEAGITAITRDIKFPDDYAEGGWWGRIEGELDPDDPQALEEVYFQGDLTADEQDTHRFEMAAKMGDKGVSPDLLGILKHTDNTWVVYQKDKASLVNSQVYKTPAAANAKIAQWMTEGQHTGENRWEMYPSDRDGEGNYYRIREKPDVAGRIDPKKPIRQTIDLGNGQSLYVLSNGQTITGPTEPVLDWEGWDPKENIKEIGGREFAIMPDGDIQPVSDRKFVSGDISVVNRYDLTDGSEVLIFSDGTKLNSQPGKALATVTDDPSGYIKITDTAGNITLKEPLTPTGIDYTAAGFNILTGEGQDLGLPERPAALETIGGQQFVRGTEAGLTALDGVLDRMIEHALVTGNVDAALAWDDFRKRPSSMEVLDRALEMAEAPGDQQLISALHHASSAQAAGMPGALGPTPEDIAAGDQFAEVAAPPGFLQEAYQTFQESITGGRLPTEDEFAAAIAREEEPPPLTVREQLELDLLDAQLAEAEANTIRLDAQSDAKVAKSAADAEAILLAANTKADLLIKEAEDKIARLNKELDFKMEQTLPLGGDAGGAAAGGAAAGGAAAGGAAAGGALSAEDLAIIAGAASSSEEFAKRGPDAITIEKLNTLMANLNPEQKALITELYGGIAQLGNASGDSMAALLATLNSAFEGADLSRIGVDGGKPPVDIWDEFGNKVTVPYALAHAPGGYLDSGQYFKSLEAWQEAHPGETPGDQEGSEDDQANIVEGNITEGTLSELGEDQQAAVDRLLEMQETGGVAFDDAAALERLEDARKARGGRFVPDETIDAGPAALAEDEEELVIGTGDTSGLAGQFQEAVYGQSASTPTPFDLGGLAGAGALPLSGTTSGTTGQQGPAPVTMGQFLNPFSGGPSVLPIQNLTTGEPAFGGFGVPTAAGITRGAGNVLSGAIGRTGIPAALSQIGGAAKSVYESFPSTERQREAERLEEEKQLSYSNMDWLAGGGVIDDNTAIVGESGPELAVFPNGTEIVPLDRKMKPAQARRLRRRGIRGMQEGGLVFPEQGEPGLGLSRALAGQAVGPSQGRIFRKAGFTTPSAQALRNLLPEELEQFRAMGARARIPEATFERELGQGIASGQRRTGSARFLPLSLRT